ncbi:MAG TPA: hypothetical protein VGN78_08390 [Solirubrobacteraceae bacterium]|jgi:hypothetical protein|nr:hypothetical protein [Solirubrobacteraceae bacterium]
MRRTRERTGRRARAPAVLTVAALVAGCGGGTTYKNNPRPPAPINITASVSGAGIAVSPGSFGAGPIVLIVTNQTGASQEITFESNELGASKPGVTQTTEPINPRGTGQLKVNVTEGRYRVRAANADIAPAQITVGPSRPSAQNDLLQP